MRWPTPVATEPDPAVQQARTVVGLYGDPDVTWSIVIELDLTVGLASADLIARLDTVTQQHAHLGYAPQVQVFPKERLRAVVRAFANAPYGDSGPVLRVALSEEGRTLVVAAHHGAIDGLGLVGLCGRLLDRPLGTNAQGIQRTGGEPGFLTSSFRRLGEALFRPPERFVSSDRHADTGDWLEFSELPAQRLGTSGLVWAATRMLSRWNAEPLPRRQPVVAVGVSRRPGRAPISPGRDTAYARLHTRGAHTRAEVTRILERSQPEPDFPETDAGGLGPWVTRLMASRLGASVLVSNLGVLSDDVVAGCRFWPTASGPNGVAIGLVTARGSTAVTLRLRSEWFSQSDARRLLALAEDELTTQ